MAVAPPNAETRGCRERVESGNTPQRDRANDVAFGPRLLGDLDSSYRDAARRVRRGVLNGEVPMKSIALLAPGAVRRSVGSEACAYLTLKLALPIGLVANARRRLAALTWT